jgi:hypothetical protein
VVVWGSMRRWPTFLTRLLVAMTLTVVAFALASTGARAHAGHDHAAHSGTSAGHQQHANAATTQSVPMARVGKVFDAGARVPKTSWLNAHHQETPTCPSGCCQSGGTCCCAAWLPLLPTFFLPQPSRLAVDLTVAGGAGIWPDALPEPPKSHV